APARRALSPPPPPPPRHPPSFPTRRSSDLMDPQGQVRIGRPVAASGRERTGRRAKPPLNPVVNGPDPLGRGPGLARVAVGDGERSEEHTSELQSHLNLVCRLLLEKKNQLKH